MTGWTIRTTTTQDLTMHGLTITVRQTGKPDVVTLSTSGIQLSSWYHFVMVIDTAQDKIVSYLNGVPNQGTASLADGASITADNALNLGGFGDPITGNTGFQGRLDDFAVWTIALAPEQVAELYARGNRGINASGL
jgi:hypothetical protein